MRVFRFNEPHHTGGYCTVDITEEQVVAHMTSIYQKLGHTISSPESLIQDFIINHWGWEISQEDSFVKSF
jgi:hypothetical protein